MGKGARLIVSGGQTTEGGVDGISSLDMKVLFYFIFALEFSRGFFRRVRGLPFHRAVILVV